MRQFLCLGSVPHLKPPSLNLACRCAEDTEMGLRLGGSQSTLPQLAGRWTSTAERYSVPGPNLKFD